MTEGITIGRRRSLLLGLPIVVASLFLPSAGAAAAIEVGFITAKSLNVRDTPNGDVIDSLPKGATVLVHDSKTGWLEVTYIRKNGGMGKGWVSAQFVKLGSAPRTRTKRERTPGRGNCDTEYKTGAEVCVSNTYTDLNCNENFTGDGYSDCDIEISYRVETNYSGGTSLSARINCSADVSYKSRESFIESSTYESQSQSHDLYAHDTVSRSMTLNVYFSTFDPVVSARVASVSCKIISLDLW